MKHSLIRSTIPSALAALIFAFGTANADSLSELASDYETITTKYRMVAGRSDVPSGQDGWPKDLPEDLEPYRQNLERLRDRLENLSQLGLEGEAKINAEYLTQIVDWRLQGLSFDEHRFSFVSHEGFYNVPYYTARNRRLHSEEDAQAWLAQMRDIPTYFEEQRINLERGMKTGWTNPDRVVDVAVTILSAQIERPTEEDGLLDPIKGLPDRIPQAVRDRLMADARKILTDIVRPTQKAMLDFIDGPYREAARPSIGIDSIPNGRAYYDFLLDYYTTTTLTAEEIHELGQSEVKRIRAEMDRVIASTGFEGSFQDWLHFMRTDPQFYAKSRQELLDFAAIASKRIDAALPAYFGMLPRQPFAVVPVPRDVEENYTTARYSGSDFSKGLPGRFLVNTSHLDQRPLYEIPALALHEAAPGHHTHKALTKENPDLPSYRKAGDMLVYREGWALYGERLGHEMGVYKTAYEKFGSLSTEMWRACRMVVDTGMHVLGWSYEKARACFTDNTALADINIDTELNRYIGAPAGAVAYKVGELKIVDMRRRAEAELGEAFDIRSFHDLILAQGQIPMTVLEQLVDDWIADRKPAGR